MSLVLSICFANSSFACAGVRVTLLKASPNKSSVRASWLTIRKARPCGKPTPPSMDGFRHCAKQRGMPHKSFGGENTLCQGFQLLLRLQNQYVAFHFLLLLPAHPSDYHDLVLSHIWIGPPAPLQSHLGLLDPIDLPFPRGDSIYQPNDPPR